MKSRLKSTSLLAVWLLSIGAVHGGRHLATAATHHAPVKNGPSFEHVHSLAMGSAGETLFLGAHTGLYRSGDGGRTWDKVSISTKHGHLDVMDIAPDPRDPKTIYIATHEAGVLKSTDGRRSWKEAGNGLGGRTSMGWPSTQTRRPGFMRRCGGKGRESIVQRIRAKSGFGWMTARKGKSRFCGR